jgi:beta-1,4-mannooligosaccharide/beta-1,4-mannosyl-N-acetylglucosamine phosphorylase
MNEVFVRRGDGPLLTPADMPVSANAVLNPGVALVNGEVVLLLRIEDRRGVSEIRVARSADGISDWRIAPTPLLEPDLPDWPYEEWGCEDARVTQIGTQEWIIAYTAYSRYGPAVALATTTDFETVTRIGTVLSPTNKDATIFPQQFSGRWMMLHRPVTGGQEHIWYATSNGDLVHWSLPGVLIPERGGPWWDGLRIGCGAPPIRTDDGWLLIYHGVKEMGNRPIYRLGLALLDLEDPRRVLARASEWIFTPQAPYELQGLVPSVVYTCGAVCRGDDVWMYYGAADTVVGLAVARTKDLVDFAKEYDYLHRVGRSKGMIE